MMSLLLQTLPLLSTTPGTSQLVNKLGACEQHNNIHFLVLLRYKNDEVIIFGERTKRDVEISHFIKEGGVINITSAKRSDTGVYTVIAENEEGDSMLDITLDVQCKCFFTLNRGDMAK